MSEPDQMSVVHNLHNEDDSFCIPEDLLAPLPSDHSLTSTTTTSSIPGSYHPGSSSRSSLSSKSTASSDRVIWGNICPHGVITSGFKSPPKARVLRSGHSDYGYGSIINTRKIIQDAVQSGDNAFKKGQYIEALEEYDRVIRMRPKNVTCRISRADTLVQLGQFEEALREYHVAEQLEQRNGTVHHRLSLFHLRQVHNIDWIFLIEVRKISIFNYLKFLVVYDMKVALGSFTLFGPFVFPTYKFHYSWCQMDTGKTHSWELLMLL